MLQVLTSYNKLAIRMVLYTCILASVFQSNSLKIQKAHSHQTVSFTQIEKKTLSSITTKFSTDIRELKTAEREIKDMYENGVTLKNEWCAECCCS